METLIELRKELVSNLSLYVNSTIQGGSGTYKGVTTEFTTEENISDTLDRLVEITKEINTK